MNNVIKLFNWYFTKKSLPYWIILAVDSIIIYVANLISIYLCCGGSILANHFWQFTTLTALSMPFIWIAMKLFHTYCGFLRYSGIIDLTRIALAILSGTCAFMLICFIAKQNGVWEEYISLRIAAFTILLATVFMWSERIMARLLFDVIQDRTQTNNVLIYGVRHGGIAIALSIIHKHPKKEIVKGFVSPDNDMVDKYLLGNKIYANDNDLNKLIADNNIKTIYVSPVVADEFRNDEQLIKTLTSNNVHIKMMHNTETWDGKSDLSYQQLHEVEIEDLLPRDKIQVDLNAIGSLLFGKRILITGAAGSIGSEMARQVAKFKPAELILVDQAETPMHDVRLFMARNYSDLPGETIVGSITNQTHMEQIFREHRPEYVFHAAAYKHVPMMENNPAMAIQNNVYGTRVIADLAVKYGTKKFVMISTDKAVNPSNVMGCSKRICEIYCQSLNAELAKGNNPFITNDNSNKDSLPSEAKREGRGGSPCQFITTRFGNVLGSNGSVIPLFKEQIKAGGPVTVTHPDIIRFFMLIPEACQLVLEAGTMGKGGEIFVFDMGKPVRIADLAQRMIDLSGAKNVEIKFTGLRDGEKLYEEVLNDAEQTKPTVHPKIKVAAVREYPYEEALRNEKELYDLSFTYDDMAIVRKMKEIVPEYKSRQSKYEVLDK